MKILMVCTNPVFKYEEGGTKKVLDGLVELCSSQNNVFFLTGLSSKDKAFLPDKDNDGGNTYYFRQGRCLGEYLHMLTDLDICFWEKLRQVIKKEKIDLLWITMPYGIVSASLLCQGMPIIYDSHAVVSDAVGITLTTLEKRSKVFRTPIIKNIVKLTLQGYISLVERLACNRATHIKAIAKTDRRRFIEKYGIGEDKITTISPFIDSHELKKETLKKRVLGRTGKVTVVFHGSYNHPPNRDAFELILNYVAPEVGKRNGNIQFLLAGIGVPVFERGNVKSLGFVEDIQALLASSDMAIVPLLEGEGVKTKIFDYMAAGLPIISTLKGIQAIEAENDKHALICDAVDPKFISAILDLANDSEKREMLGKNALELAKTKYGQETMQTRMDELLAKVIVSKKIVRTSRETTGKMKKPNVGIITYPGQGMSMGAAYLQDFFSEILVLLCGSLIAITGDIPEINNKAIRLMRLPFHESGSHSLFGRVRKYMISQLRIFPKLIKMSRSCDTIIFFDLAEFYAPLIFITKFFLRKKVMIIHCALTSKSFGVMYNKKWFGLGAVVSYLVRLVERVSFSLVDRITVESESIIKLHGLEGYRRKISICRFYYIDTGAFNIERDIKARHNLVGYIGRFGEDKGATNFAQAIGKIDSLEDVEFLMVGGFSGEFNKIEEILNEHKIQHKVTLVGRIPHQKIPDYLNELKLFILPSYREGLPKAILEAMACGTPVLATPVGGIPDVIRDEETGFILEDNSPECIAKNIIRALEYPKLDEIITNARDLVEREYTYEPTLKRWKKVF